LNYLVNDALKMGVTLCVKLWMSYCVLMDTYIWW